MATAAIRLTSPGGVTVPVGLLGLMTTMIFVFGVGSLVMMPVAGLQIARLGSRRVSIITTLLFIPTIVLVTLVDSIWMGAADSEGRVVSYIQSLYWEFGSACVLPATGVLMQNRGASFSLERGAVRTAILLYRLTR